MTPRTGPYVSVRTAVKVHSRPSTTNLKQYTVTFTTHLLRHSGTPGTEVDAGVGVHHHTSNAPAPVGWQNIQTQRNVVVDKEAFVDTSFETYPNNMYRLSSTVRTLADRHTSHRDGIMLIVHDDGEVTLDTENQIRLLEQCLVRRYGPTPHHHVANETDFVNITGTSADPLKACVHAVGEAHAGRNQFAVLNIGVSEYPLASASGLRCFKEELRRQNVIDKTVEFTVKSNMNYAIFTTLKVPSTQPHHRQPAPSWLLLSVSKEGVLIDLLQRQ